MNLIRRYPGQRQLQNKSPTGCPCLQCQLAGAEAALKPPVAVPVPSARFQLVSVRMTVPVVSVAVETPPASLVALAHFQDLLGSRKNKSQTLLVILFLNNHYPTLMYRY